MGAVLGLIFGLGITIICWAWQHPREEHSVKPKNRQPSKLKVLLIGAGMPDTSPRVVSAACFCLWMLSMGLIYVLTRTASIALIISVPIGFLPVYLLKLKASQRAQKIAQLWPDVIDDILAGVRSGMSLAEVLIQLEHSGPEPLQADFTAFAAEYRSHGRLYPALEVLRWRINSVDATRLIEVLRLTHEVGSTDLGVLLRELSAMIRVDLRTRGEIAARQSWTTNAARLAVASPWVVLLLVSTRTDSAQVYSTPQGVAVLLGGLLVSIFAYWLMLRLGRLSVRR